MLNQFPTRKNLEGIKKDFPILNREIHAGKKITYLDSAATAQKPESVIQAMDHYYRFSNANIHRGIHVLAEEATSAYEGARQKVASFIGAASSQEVVFTRNTTESINLVANSWGRKNLKQGDLVILTEMEHHSNLVPWQMLANEIGIRLEFISVTSEGELDLENFDSLLKQEPKLVAFVYMSNVLGTINPAIEIIEKARAAGALTLIDAAQSVPHLPFNLGDLKPDFAVFSAHKMLGPTGIGVLWGRKELLASMTPFMGGGDMIKKVHLRDFTPNDLPHKFEAGTPAIAEAIGFGAAIDYLSNLGMDNVSAHEKAITKYALEKLKDINSVNVFGPAAEKKGAVLSFTMDGIHPHDVAQILDTEGIAVRAGHHCAMPLHEKFQIPATTRASFYIYNSMEDVDLLVKGLEKVIDYFG